MVFQYITQLKKIENKQTDLLICDLKSEKIIENENILKTNLIQFLINVSKNLQCLLFAHCIIEYNTYNCDAVIIISNGDIIDIYEENDIETKFNLSLYDTRFGKIGILINSDIYSENILYAFESLKTDLIILFATENIKNDFFKLNTTLPYILITDKALQVSNTFNNNQLYN